VTWQFFNAYAESFGGLDFVDPYHGWSAAWHTIMRFDGTVFSAPEHPAVEPLTFTLHPAYPNPFNATTTLSFELPSVSRTRVDIFDITGRLVRTLSDRIYPPGPHVIHFDAEALPSGLYFARVTAGNFRATQKMVLIR